MWTSQRRASGSFLSEPPRIHPDPSTVPLTYGSTSSSSSASDGPACGRSGPVSSVDLGNENVSAESIVHARSACRAASRVLMRSLSATAIEVREPCPRPFQPEKVKRLRTCSSCTFSITTTSPIVCFMKPRSSRMLRPTWCRSRCCTQ